MECGEVLGEFSPSQTITYSVGKAFQETILDANEVLKENNYHKLINFKGEDISVDYYVKKNEEV